MAKWIKWRDIFNEKMKDQDYKKRFELGYAKFTKELEAELAAERSQASSHPCDRSHEHSYGAHA